MFNCSLKILIRQGHHLHLGELRGIFFISAAISLLKVFSIIYLSPPVVCIAADFSTLGYALLCFAQSGSVFIFFAWFYLSPSFCKKLKLYSFALHSPPQPWEGTPYNGYTLRLLPKAVHSSGFLGILIKGQEFHMMRYMKQKGNLLWDI